MSAALTKGSVGGVGPKSAAKNFTSVDQRTSLDPLAGAQRIVLKATAVLQEAVGDLIPKSSFTSSTPASPVSGLEAIAEELRQQASKLVASAMSLQSRDFQRGVPTLATGLQCANEEPAVEVLKPPPAIHPGKSGCVVLTLENEDNQEIVLCSLFTTELVGCLGNMISKGQITVAPSSVRLGPGESSDVRIEFQIPADMPVGLYAGLLQTFDDRGGVQKFVLQVQVGS